MLQNRSLWSLRRIISKTTDQLNLPFGQSEETLSAHLQQATGKKISVTLTDNSTSMISVRAKEGFFQVRLHRMFLQAGDALIAEIASFIGRRRGRTPLIREFILLQSSLIRKASPRRCLINPIGKHHDLSEIVRSVNDEYFGGRITAPVTWGTRRRGRAVRRRTLGSYSSNTNTVRINPLLDRKKVPSFFIEFIVYHEMLHADMGVGEKEGRRTVHCREFRRREKMFDRYAEAIAWEKEMNFLF